jgi:RNA-directed DNA polymerase
LGSIILLDLSKRLRSGAYKAKPTRRVYIPKTDGKLRPLGVTVLEDKIVQRAFVMVLNSIYEADFMGFSYGFRPKRGQHQALDAIHEGIARKKVNYIFDADIRDFFNKINREWLIKFIEHRIADKRIIKLIQKWLNAGILEEGKIIYNDCGTVQGSAASPLLANVFLHYVYDLWIHHWRKQRVRGNVIVVRYADDTVVGFQYESDAKLFQVELKKRLQKCIPRKQGLSNLGALPPKIGKDEGKENPKHLTS